ncbi:MAG: carbohydrate ABC transporter permease [Phycisphaerales bacterium]
MCIPALLLGAAVFIIPLLWMLSTAVKPIDQAMSSPPRWLPYSWAYTDNGKEITVGLDSDVPDDGSVSVQVAYQWLIEIDSERVPVAPVGDTVSGGMTRVVINYHTQALVDGVWRPAQLADPDWAPPPAPDGEKSVEAVYLDDEGYTIRHTFPPSDVKRVYDQTKDDLVGSFAGSQTLTVPAESLIKTVIPWDDRTELAHAQTERRGVERSALSKYIDFRWENFGKAIRAMKLFPTYLKNTIILCVLTVIGTVCSSTLVAYGFARIEWPGRDKVFLVVLATMMVPFPVVMVPLFTMFKNFGWIGTLKPLWVTTFFAGAFNIFLLRQFFRTIPKDLSESARIDGCSELRIFWQIILPLARPAIAVVALFQFMGTWNDFLGPLIYLTEQKDFTLALGLQAYQSQSGGTQWHYLMAASSLVVLPVIVLFFLAQRSFIEGISMTGLKG